MLWIELPGGVVAGVAGMERALLRLVSMDMGFVLGAPPMPCWPHWKLFSDAPMLPMTLDALVGGVGKVCARSSDGRPELLWDGSDDWGPGRPMLWW